MTYPIGQKMLPIWLLSALTVFFAGCAVKSPPPPPTLNLSSEASTREGIFTGKLFLATEQEITACLEMPGRKITEPLDWTWLAPDGSAFIREKRRFFGTADCARLNLAGTEAMDKPGLWTLRVASKERVVAERDFHLAASKDQWKAVNAEHPNMRVVALQALCEQEDFVFLARRFSFDLWPKERRVILDCLKGSAEKSAPVVAKFLRVDPANETMLAMAYRLKRDLVKRLLASGQGREEKLASLTLLLNEWDAELAAELLDSDDRLLRLEGVKLVARTESPLVPLLLKNTLGDPEPEVRLSGVEALTKYGGSVARNVIQARLQEEPNDNLRKRIEQVLKAWK